MSEPRRIQTQSGVTGVERAIALHAACEYCRENGLSFDKLKQQRLLYIGGVAAFVAPSQVKPVGLLNDMATQPRPVLILRDNNGTLEFEQTEHTTRYIK